MLDPLPHDVSACNAFFVIRHGLIDENANAMGLSAGACNTSSLYPTKTITTSLMCMAVKAHRQAVSETCAHKKIFASPLYCRKIIFVRYYNNNRANFLFIIFHQSQCRQFSVDFLDNSRN